jgi:ribosomal protein S18 acetylase RimI-like enzyme
MATTLRAARDRERRAALELLYHYLPADERARRITSAQAMLTRGDMDPAGLVVSVERSKVRGAILAISLAGASALLYPPQVVGEDPELEDRLILHTLDWLYQRGIRLVQSLGSSRDLEHYASLLRHGFTHPGRLWYLHHDLETLPDARAAPPFRLVPSGEAGDRFGRTLLATYEDTLDFPELTTCRSLEEILAGHRGTTAHDPDLWWLIEADGIDAGVALVGLLADSGEWDLSYLGLVPSARGRGLGRAVLREILRRARAAPAMQVILAVDERNLPAWRLYRSAGFVPEEPREVFLKVNLGISDTPLSVNAPVLPSAPST